MRPTAPCGADKQEPDDERTKGAPAEFARLAPPPNIHTPSLADASVNSWAAVNGHVQSGQDEIDPIGDGVLAAVVCREHEADWVVALVIGH
jgi:hypothetical protein